MSILIPRRRAIVAMAAVFAVCAAGLAQSTRRAAFVGNNGNLEGAVTSYVFDGNGAPVFVSKFVTGSRPNSQEYHPGTNAYGISLTPNGRFLVTSHTTSSETVERLTFMRVNADATVSAETTFTTPDSPLDIQWLTNEFLAVTRTNLSVTNQVIVYRFDEEALTLTEVDRENTGSFNAYLAIHPSRRFLYAQDSTLNQVHPFRINNNGTLTPLGAVSTGGTYPLGPGLTQDGTKLYAGGGISNSGNKVVGFHVDPNSGVPTLMAGSPFLSPGASPKVAVASAADGFLLVGHGTDATMRSFTINPATGALTYAGGSFDVGLQGSLGDIAVLDELVLVTDNTTATDGIQGLYSFRINPNGTFSQNGAAVPSQGTAPQFISVWTPCRPCDVNCDGSVNAFDIQSFVDLQSPSPPAGCSPCAGDVNGDGSINPFDIVPFTECLSG